MARVTAERMASGARSVARKLAVQALYGWQLNPSAWQDVVQAFDDDADMPKADTEYFRSLIAAVGAGSDSLDAALVPWMDRKPAELDPIERAVLWIGTHELRAMPDVPFRVVISEAVSLAKRFGATDSHRFVNAVLDKAARELRPHEH
ncbi:MAG TPA: transcription antitermination factor NusB [Steroidobacteraceae bacterium]|nr:transcription antitermination factor NusB [Steroidobacteraceae bacterium]